MKDVFNDPKLQAQFDRDGYVQVDLLNPDELQAFGLFLERVKSAGQNGAMNVDSSYKLSFFRDDPEYRRKVLQEIGAYFQKKLDGLLNGYRPLIINIFDKEPGGGEVPIHQNWTFVDESKYTSVSVWIPLVDVSRENGTLEFVKGSHRVLSKFRSPTIPWVFDGLWDKLKEKYLQPLEIRAGQAGILDDSIIHWSSENDSQKVRTAVQLIMVPEEATPIHYFRPSERPDILEIYQVDADFFTTFNMKEKPAGVPCIGEVGYSEIYYDEGEMVERIAQNNPSIRDLA